MAPIELDTALAVRDHLWDELDNFGLLVPRDVYRAQRPKVTQRGRVEYLRLRRHVGDWTWHRVLENLPRPYTSDDCARVLGFGHALARFCLPPRHIEPSAKEEVLGLGALANFLVSVYDQLLDLGAAEPSVLPRKYLRRAGRGNQRGPRRWVGRFLARPRKQLMVRLVDRYYRGLNSLPYARTHPAVMAMIQKAVLTMYDAERYLAQGGSLAPDRLTLRRKAALPFVVMGLPAWLGVATCSSQARQRHLRWLYRMGDFIGWIDDVVDLYEDGKDGHPNRAAEALDRTEPVEFARWIAEKGARVVDERDAWFEAEAMRDGPGSQALSLVVASWFGGSAQYDRQGSGNGDAMGIKDRQTIPARGG